MMLGMQSRNLWDGNIEGTGCVVEGDSSCGLLLWYVVSGISSRDYTQKGFSTKNGQTTGGMSSLAANIEVFTMVTPSTSATP